MLSEDRRQEPADVNKDVSSEASLQPQSENGGNLTIKEILCSLDFWLWTITILLMFAVTLTIYTNVGTYLRSLDIEDKTGLVSGLGAAAAVCFSSATLILSDATLERVDRITFLIIYAAIQTALLIWVIGYIHIFPLFLALMLLTYIFQMLLYSLAPIITLEYFGEAHFGRLYGSILFASGIMTLLVQFWFAHLYETQVPANSNSKTCVGAHCFNSSSKMLCILSTVSLITGGFLWYRRKRRKRNGQYQTLL